MDYQLGEDIKEKIVPKAVDYFTGKALEYDMMDEDDDDYEDIDEDDDDDDLDDVSVPPFSYLASPPYTITGYRLRWFRPSAKKEWKG